MGVERPLDHIIIRSAPKKISSNVKLISPNFYSHLFELTEYCKNLLKQWTIEDPVSIYSFFFSSREKTSQIKCRLFFSLKFRPHFRCFEKDNFCVWLLNIWHRIQSDPIKCSRHFAFAAAIISCISSLTSLSHSRPSRGNNGPPLIAVSVTPKEN